MPEENQANGVSFKLAAAVWGLLILSAIACLTVAANIAIWRQAYTDAGIIGVVGLALLWKQYSFAVNHRFQSVGRAERQVFVAAYTALSLMVVAVLIWWFGYPDRPIPSQFGQAALKVRQALPTFLIALNALVIGWLGAHVVAFLLRRGLRRLKINARLKQWTEGERRTGAIDVEVWSGRAVYYLIMLLVLVVFFQLLGLTALTQPLTRLLDQVARFLPRLMGAALVLFFAWGLATILQLIIGRGLGAVDFDQRIGGGTSQGEGKFSPGDSVAATVYWLVLLLFLPAILSALQLPGLFSPIQAMLKKALGYFPNIVTAGLILAVGWFVAKAVQRIVTNVLASVGLDGLSERAHLTTVLGPQGLSNAIGVILYVLILVPVLIAALNALDLQAVARPASNMLSTILAAVPAILAACVVLALAYVIGHVLAGLTTNFLGGVGLDAMLPQMGTAGGSQVGGKKPSEVAGYLVLVAVMLLAAVEAAYQMGFVLMAQLFAWFVAFAGRVVLGLVIFGIGLYLAEVASRTLRASGAVQAAIMATTAKIAIMVLAGAMALRQMGLGSEIINITFGLLFGAVVVALAIALGLGAQEVAAQQLSAWLEAMRTPRRRRQNR